MQPRSRLSVGSAAIGAANANPPVLDLARHNDPIAQREIEIELTIAGLELEFDRARHA